MRREPGGGINERSLSWIGYGKIEERYGIPAEALISFAANVSPLGVSERYLEGIKEKLRCVERYPERDYKRLREALAAYCGADAGHIIAGSGSSEIISAVIKHRSAPKVLIVAPAYAEYERNVLIAGGSVSYYRLKEEDGFEFDAAGLAGALSEDTDILMLCNPLNPTGTAIRADELETVIKRCAGLDIICVVDETYIDFADREYDATLLTDKYPGLFVIRSMSKFFCAPGLRLGYGITSDAQLLREIEENKDPWSVSSLSEEAAILMLSDKEYIESARAYMEEERSRVCGRLDELKETGISYIRPRANFVLVHLPEDGPSAKELFLMALKDNMMIRDCSDYAGLEKGYIRFCFMKKEDDDRLLSLIREAYA
ncbi:MAG: aminotransferase class I/II-fold pyridoxal phosphate-dependent enzyme [Lachnospiraceae bacterium]|nr:aminotransferase class I/II-fold pyridoxal phosphate-dependent enzyme [Lachnospiraceae bacterium]